MPKGGARANSGPPPDPNALRRDRQSDKDGWTTLPAEGRKGRTPPWPLIPDIRDVAQQQSWEQQIADLEVLADDPDLKPAARAKLDQRLARAREQLTVVELRIAERGKLETTVWRALWKTPQAVVWEKQGWVREVAVYARHRVLGELGSLDDAKEARQWSDRLGLNPAAMLRNRWKVSADHLAERRQQRARRSAPAQQPRRSARDRMKALDGGGA